MLRMLVSLGAAAGLAWTMNVALSAAQAERSIQLRVQNKGVPAQGVEVALYAANQGKVSLGATASDGSLDFALSAANLGKVQVDVIVDECPDGSRVQLVAPGGPLPPADDKCRRRRLGAFRWDRARRIVIDVTGGVTVTGGGLSGAVIGGIAGGAGAAVVAAVAAGGGSAGSSAPAASTPSTPTQTTTITGTFSATVGPASNACSNDSSPFNVEYMIRENSDGSISVSKSGLPFQGTRSGNRVNVVFTGPLTAANLSWLHPTTRNVRWEQTFTFNETGTQFTVAGVVTPMDGDCRNQITHGGTATRR
ncbi:MAG: hypothetical protein HYZ58_08840 [Acidobacteria bacterium]|nr:hypothetical protein [Acidobacteriota bacterium]MBI3263245.1 hypothetical protein [Acidobacteriota bacterium]